MIPILEYVSKPNILHCSYLSALPLPIHSLPQLAQLVMHGLDAIRGNIEDYRVSTPTGLDFPYLHGVE